MVLESAPAPTPVEVLREIDDPYNGDRWLLERDPGRPGPGRLVRVAAGAARSTEQRAGPVLEAHGGIGNPAAQPGQAIASAPALPVIRAGDRLIVEENTPVVEARLAAIALGPAPAGSPFNVRLEIGGKVVRARALASGRAELMPEIGGQP